MFVGGATVFVGGATVFVGGATVLVGGGCCPPPAVVGAPGDPPGEGDTGGDGEAVADAPG